MVNPIFQQKKKLLICFKEQKIKIIKKDSLSEVLYQLVAGVRIHRVWKFKNTVRKASSADVISKICHKKSFTRHFMEKTMGLTKGQAYWYIWHFLKDKIIVKLGTVETIGYVSHPQAKYKYVGH